MPEAGGVLVAGGGAGVGAAAAAAVEAAQSWA